MGRRKFNIGDKVIGNDKKGSFAERKGMIIGYNKMTHEYQVRFDNGEIEYVNSGWLDKLQEGGKKWL